MCQEVFELVCKMDMKDVETRMALQCAPVITGIKISNLLILQEGSEKVLHRILRGSGISYFRLLKSGGKVTYLLFRQNRLVLFLSEKRVRDILRDQGYTDLRIGAILSLFQKRYEAYMERGGSFPHEMGVLLGYPVEDVRGFIENQGKNFLYSGYWKVYENVREKKETFRLFEKARELLVQRLAAGVNVRDMIMDSKAEAFSALA